MKTQIFFIDEKDRVRFIKTLVKYYQFFQKFNKETAGITADKAYEFLIVGLDKDGKAFDTDLEYFEEILQHQTDYLFPDSIKPKYKRGYKNGRKAPKTKINVDEFTSDDRAKIKEIKETLLGEYPHLQRKDLKEDIDNYCMLKVKLNKLLSGEIVKNNIAVKNLADTQIKLGSYLGIDEGQKAKQKAEEGRQSIASLSSTFEETIQEYPELMIRFRYKEVRILLEKLDRQEISKELFVLPAWAGCSVAEARSFIHEHEAKFEPTI